MHAVIVRVTVNDAEASETVLREQVVPRVAQAPGFVAGYWTRQDDSGLSMVIFESEEAANRMSEQVPSLVPDSVTLDQVEVREVVAPRLSRTLLAQGEPAERGGWWRHIRPPRPTASRGDQRTPEPSDGDDDLPLRVSLADVPKSVGDFAQLVAPVDDRRHVARLEQLSQDLQVRPVDVCDEEDDLAAARNAASRILTM